MKEFSTASASMWFKSDVQAWQPEGKPSVCLRSCLRFLNSDRCDIVVLGPCLKRPRGVEGGRAFEAGVLESPRSTSSVMLPGSLPEEATSSGGSVGSARDA